MKRPYEIAEIAGKVIQMLISKTIDDKIVWDYDNESVKALLYDENQHKNLAIRFYRTSHYDGRYNCDDFKLYIEGMIYSTKDLQLYMNLSDAIENQSKKSFSYCRIYDILKNL
jgi:hypothetical protein